MASDFPFSDRLRRRRAIQLLATVATALAGARIISPAAQAKPALGAAPTSQPARDHPVQVYYRPDHALAARSVETIRKSSSINGLALVTLAAVAAGATASTFWL